MKILITGSKGFVGASFGRFAAAAGHEVLGVARSAQPDPAWPGRHFQGDTAQTDLSPLIREFNPALLVHAAGSASVGASISDPLADFRATASTLMNVLDGIRRSGREPLVVFPSSAAVYGNPRALPVGENSACEPISPYGFHKAASEILAQEYARCFGLSIVVCRLFSLFGEFQRRLLVWEIYHQLAGPAAQVELQGTGAESRDFLQIDDLSSAILALFKVVPRQACTILNVARGRETPILDLAESMCSLVAPDKEIVCRGLARPGDPLRWSADIRLLRSFLPGWKPRELDEALAATIDRWRKQPSNP